MKEQIRQALASKYYGHTEQGGLTPAAVLILFYEQNGEHYIVFTRRTSRVEHHKGEISFPGGAWHQGVDVNLVATALRETDEEIGVPVQVVEILGQAPGTVTRSGFVVSAFVGYSQQRPGFVKNEVEVDEIIEVPLSHLLAPEAAKYMVREWQGITIPGPYYEYQDNVIWGATGRMLQQFLAEAFPSQTQPAR